VAVDASRIVTAALGIAAPLWSVIVPTKLPVGVWAKTPTVRSERTANNVYRKNLGNLMNTPPNDVQLGYTRERIAGRGPS